MIIESVLSGIESQANNLLGEMGVEHRLRFSFQKELKKKAAACQVCGRVFARGELKCKACDAPRGNEVSDTMEVKVVDAGKLQSFDQDSGGGKALLALVVRIALARFLGLRILFLDEVCSNLDAENLNSVVEMIQRLPDLGFRQVFVISHRRDLLEQLNACVVITRDPVAGRSFLGIE